MPYYNNQRAHGVRNTGCQRPYPAVPPCQDAAPCTPAPAACTPAPASCAPDPACPGDRTPGMQVRPSCPISNSCGSDTNICCSLAVANVVNQKPESPTYDVERAFIIGTIYKELDKPFLGEGGCRR